MAAYWWVRGSRISGEILKLVMQAVFYCWKTRMKEFFFSFFLFKALLAIKNFCEEVGFSVVFTQYMFARFNSLRLSVQAYNKDQLCFLASLWRSKEHYFSALSGNSKGVFWDLTSIVIANSWWLICILFFFGVDKMESSFFLWCDQGHDLGLIHYGVKRSGGCKSPLPFCFFFFF